MAIKLLDDTMASYYYLRDENNEPAITVCLIRKSMNTRPIARGIAICSPMDNFDQKSGIKISTQNAVRALLGREAAPIARPEAKKVLSDVGCTFKKHGYKNPALTHVEKSIQSYI